METNTANIIETPTVPLIPPLSFSERGAESVVADGNTIDASEDANNEGEGQEDAKQEEGVNTAENTEERKSGYTPPTFTFGRTEEKKEEEPVVPTVEKEVVYVKVPELEELDETAKKALNYALKNGARAGVELAEKMQEFIQKSAEIPVADVLEIVANEEKAISLIAEDLRIKNSHWSEERIQKAAKKEYDSIEYGDEDDKKFFYEDLARAVNQNRAKVLEGVDSNIFAEFKAQQEPSVPDLSYESFEADYLPKIKGEDIKLPELTVKREDGSVLSIFERDRIAAIEEGANQMLATYLYNATVWNGKEWVLPDTFTVKEGEEEKIVPASEWVEKVRQNSLQTIEFMEKGRNYDKDMLHMEKGYLAQLNKQLAAAREEMKQEYENKIKQFTGLDKKPIMNSGGGEIKPKIQPLAWEEKKIQ